jgi:hypothetical protein
MQLPSIDRIPSQRPIASEAAALSTGRVIPVPPVNSSLTGIDEQPSPSVINMINTAIQTAAQEGSLASVGETGSSNTQADEFNKQWTQRQLSAEQPENPPKPPLYEVLISQLKALWEASASAVQVQQQVKEQLEPKTALDALKGTLATEVFTYSPTKITKTEKPQT